MWAGMDSRQEYTIYFAAKTSATELKAELSQSVALRVFAFYKKATESSCTKMTAVCMYRIYKAVRVRARQRVCVLLVDDDMI